MKITVQQFGTLPNGDNAMMYILENNNKMRVHITNLGGVITNMFVPDKNGDLADVVLGHKDFDTYVTNPAYFNALIGRNANRIANGELSIGDKTFSLEQNDGTNNLHSGKDGLHSRLFLSEVRTVGNIPALLLSHKMESLSDGFPGELTINVAYALTDDNALMIDYRAVSDEDTVINLTNHAYFNLAGHDSGNIHKHVMQIDADYFLPMDEKCLPNGEILKVEGTPFDFRTPKEIGKDIFSDYPQTKMVGGFDHNFVLGGGYDYRKVVTVSEPDSGRVMTVFTDLPGIQLYTSNMLDETLTYKDGAAYKKHQAFCLETQLFPNAVNMPWLASPIYHAGEEYITTTTYQFSIV
ncbi:MAG: galactose mutarotase [Oscillospiraceae bacterium]|nr:galactose mutarotase [Oscillospiraceae bacterium]